MSLNKTIQHNTSTTQLLGGTFYSFGIKTTLVKRNVKEKQEKK